MAVITNYEDVERRRRVYETAEGLDTLAEEFHELGLFEAIDATDPQAVERHNLAVRKLYLLGILQDRTVDEVTRVLFGTRQAKDEPKRGWMKRVVDALLKIEYKENNDAR